MYKNKVVKMGAKVWSIQMYFYDVLLTVMIFCFHHVACLLNDYFLHLMTPLEALEILEKLEVFLEKKEVVDLLQ